ncbi:hypothetical protein LTR64_006906 [Lithohypha guttulata]|uniref:uncharacterized protein n=1 Tax=Lithohypha guttulata TaxID=1690604 RepID=UPI002DE05D2B|nr:hypothetical protein LTR51_004536 [Lithohypha guttulata]
MAISGMPPPAESTPLLYQYNQQPLNSQPRLSYYRPDDDHQPLSHKDISGNNAHTQFCALTGCPPSNAGPKNKISIPKKSLYGRVVSQLSSQRRAYNFSASLNNLLLLSQVVLGAALTALGASASSHILITIFGATNTIIAGLVAYLKSRGQPMRARMYRDDLERLVDEIENSEVMWRGISEGIHGYDEIDTDEVTVRSEVARLTRLYDRAIRLNGMNNPDMYMAGAGGFDGNAGGGARPSRAMAAGAPAPLPIAAPALPQAAGQPSAPAAPAAENPEDAAPATKAAVKKEDETAKEESKAEDKSEGKKPATDGTSDDPSEHNTPSPSSSSKSNTAPPPTRPAIPAHSQSQPPPTVPHLLDDPDASPATAARLKPKRTRSDKPQNANGGGVEKVAGDDEDHT